MFRIHATILLILAAASLGCGSGEPTLIPGRSPTIPVQGKITLEGTPIEGATVMFFSEKLKITSYGKTDATGQYELTTYEPGDGAPIGRYQVSVKKTEQKIIKESDHPALPPKSQTSELLPPQYSDYESSELKAVVSEGGTNSFLFNLMP
ncbi:carboxypeptidase-like regulatory domain-containing protein [Bremerella sp. P1]|uniref:carboxypeptidase-like regulatory domain-containing protein n=1 Tax=Bremerella sp. P1 TaxID=3026424 RepID=UPI0023685A82|nr:carboxypeptidase-like regulatory domain-containing protein [Bremerella sp. P1]WDI43298.1 carboxypeptidase-like regulatory domain-containing protein [Bremerella sp. P1]